MSGKSFSEYALEYSEDKASAIKGGSLGWITEKLVVTKFRQVMVNTEVGDVSEPFNTRFDGISSSWRRKNEECYKCY